MKQKHKKAILYIRVSTVDQGENGIGLEGQTLTIENYATLNGIEITHRFQDIASARGENNLNKRPGLKAAIEVAQAQRIPILVSGLDRLSRHMRTTEELFRKHRITVISATEGLMDPVILSSRAARAEYDGKVISETTKAALQKLKKQGVKLGNPVNLPQAQKNGAASNKARAEAKANEIADVLASLPGQEQMTGAEIARELNSRGITTGRGGQWAAGNIHRPLKLARDLLEGRRLEHYRSNPLYGRF